MPPLDPSQSTRAYLAYHLKRLREERGWSQTKLGSLVYVSGSLISGIETLQRTPTQKNLTAMDRALTLDQFFGPLYPRVLEESGLPAGFPEYADAEASASMIRFYQNFVITGLFQTEEYATAVLRAGQQPSKLGQLVATRLARQEILSREDPPAIISLLDATAIRRRFGGAEVMRGQLQRLLELNELPHVHIHIVPAEAELSPEGAFILLSSPGEADVSYAEMAGGRGQLIDNPEYVAELGILFELIRSKALTAEDSQHEIRKALEEL